MVNELKNDAVIDYGYASDKQKIIKFVNKIYSIPVEDCAVWEPEILNFFSKELIVPYVLLFSSKDDTNSTAKEINSIKEVFLSDFIDKMVVHISFSRCYAKLIMIKESLDAGVDIEEYSNWFFSKCCSFRRMAVKRRKVDDTRFKDFSQAIQPSSRECRTPEGLVFYEKIYFVLPDKDIEYPLTDWGHIISENFIRKIKKNMQDRKPKNNNKRTPIDSRLRHECFKRDNYTCKECGATNKEKTLHADHILPVSQGGNDELDNLQTLCDHCNLAKSNKKWKNGCERNE